jgi:glycosyltransferase involved in cell wall biosynthesis
MIASIIPTTVHYVWLSGKEKPTSVLKCIESWRFHNPRFTLREWTLDDLSQLDGDLAAFCKSAIAAKKWAFATDYIRLRVLSNFGGVYLDSDVLAYQPMDALLSHKGFIPWESKNKLGPHVIGAVAGHPLISAWLRAYEERSFVLDQFHFNQTPMPDVITNISVDHFGLRRFGQPQVISDDFQLIPASVATSSVNDRCVFEHLYAGSWLDDAHSEFGTNLKRENSHFYERQKLPLRRAINAARTVLDRGNLVGAGKQRADDGAKNLQFRDARDTYLGKSYPIKFWHVARAAPLFSRVSIRRAPAKVSVIVPVYNTEAYLEACLASLSRQDHGNAEFLIVNDGSSDSSGEIAERFAETDDRFKILHKANGGLASARNAGLAVFTGDYVAFLDGDDWVAPKFLSRMAAGMTNNVDVVACDFSRVLPSGQSVEHSDIGAFYGERNSVKQLLLSISDCFAWGKLFRRRAFDLPAFRFSDGWFEDLSVIPAIVGAARECYFTQKRDYKYVQRTGSILRSSLGNPWKMFDVFGQFSQLVEKQSYFKHENWNIYYEWKILQHLFFYRLDSVRQQSNSDLKRELRRELAKRLNAAMPNWTEAAVMKEYLSVRDRGERRKRLKLVAEFRNGQ